MNRKLFPSAPREDLGTTPVKAPLADRMRPLRLDDVLGQEHLLNSGKILREMIRLDEISSMILWGPPGVGKTTLARIIARETNSHFVELSAVMSGIKDVKRVVEEASYERRGSGRHTILFVDEIHRFNKAQQNAFLPHVERGTIILIGASTENPSFEVVPPLLSRTRVLVLKTLNQSHLVEILKRALADHEKGLATWNLDVEDEALQQIALFSNGDARAALNSLEVVAQLAYPNRPGARAVTRKLLAEAFQKRTLLYDKAGEEHFNLISALHKSLRNSDVDASLYWLGRMLESGEDPLYLARRMVRFASEDVGMADPAALGYAMDAMQAVHFIGLPEGTLALAQIAIYLAQTPKSNSVYEAYSRVKRDIEKDLNQSVPLHLRNATTSLARHLGYGKGYRYAHHEQRRVAKMSCLPEQLVGRQYYRPSQEGFEKTITSRLQSIKLRSDSPKPGDQKTEKN